MSLAFYGNTFYGTTRYGSSNALDVDVSLFYHITPVENLYGFYWEINPLSVTNQIPLLDWELQISDDDLFDNYSSYNSSTAVQYHDGNSVKGFDILLPARVSGGSTVYARVRAKKGSAYSQFSSSISVSIFPNFVEDVAEDLLIALVGDNVYNKDVLNMTPDERNTNLFTIFRMYGNELDQAKLEIEKTKIDTSIEKCRDDALYANFGSYLTFPKPTNMEMLLYRQILRKMFASLPFQGTNQAIINTVIPFTGVNPTITNARDQIDFVCYDTVIAGTSFLDDLGTPPNTITINNAASGLKIYLNNPASFTLDLNIITILINIMIPSHVYYNTAIV